MDFIFIEFKRTHSDLCCHVSRYCSFQGKNNSPRSPSFTFLIHRRSNFCFPERLRFPRAPVQVISIPDKVFGPNFWASDEIPQDPALPAYFPDSQRTLTDFLRVSSSRESILIRGAHIKDAGPLGRVRAHSTLCPHFRKTWASALDQPDPTRHPLHMRRALKAVFWYTRWMWWGDPFF